MGGESSERKQDLNIPVKPEHLVPNKWTLVVTTVNLLFKDQFMKTALHPAEQDQKVGWKAQLLHQARTQGDEGVQVSQGR